MEEHDSLSEQEISSWAPLKLTARGGRPGAYTPPLRQKSSDGNTSRNETKKEIQEDDEATLRELLIRWKAVKRYNRHNNDVVAASKVNSALKSLVQNGTEANLKSQFLKIDAQSHSNSLDRLYRFLEDKRI